jgi:hypothetical protein
MSECRSFNLLVRIKIYLCRKNKGVLNLIEIIFITYMMIGIFFCVENRKSIINGINDHPRVKTKWVMSIMTVIVIVYLIFTWPRMVFDR